MGRSRPGSRPLRPVDDVAPPLAFLDLSGVPPDPEPRRRLCWRCVAFWITLAALVVAFTR